MTDCEDESVKHCPVVTGDWKSEMVRRSVGVKRCEKPCQVTRRGGD